MEGQKKVVMAEELMGRICRRDFEVLTALNRFGMLSAGQIKDIYYNGAQYGYHRLRLLSRRGLVADRPLLGSGQTSQQSKRVCRKITSMYALTAEGARLISGQARRVKNEYLHKYFLIGEIYRQLVAEGIINPSEWLTGLEIKSQYKNILKTNTISAAILRDRPIGLYIADSRKQKDLTAHENSMAQGFDRHHVLIAKYPGEVRQQITNHIQPGPVTVLSFDEAAEWLGRHLRAANERRDTVKEALNKGVKALKSKNKTLEIRPTGAVLVPAYHVTGYREFYLVEYATRNENVLAVIRDRIKRGQDHFMVIVADDEQERIVRTVLGDSPYVKTLML
ncbi:hypothetical protein Tfer_0909 [Thermincola ferriacetica]|uniref:Uncharacterized protein n=1 Tax=Thermincola ferriacetica TaxID=281456 RepID=A0A0L6W5I1_9FIRM|nr:hypothetical protein [Thermincola ferriacetica]KNZ70349.1 hypothetical protein Tfer_0909 [Thermincola ferriacetica]